MSQHVPSSLFSYHLNSATHSEVIKPTQGILKSECSQQPFVESFQADVLKSNSFKGPLEKVITEEKNNNTTVTFLPIFIIKVNNNMVVAFTLHLVE